MSGTGNRRSNDGTARNGARGSVAASADRPATRRSSEGTAPAATRAGNRLGDVPDPDAPSNGVTWRGVLLTWRGVYLTWR